MRSTLILSLILLAVPTAILADDTPEGFQAIFNGKDLDGWHGWWGLAPIKLKDASEEELKQKRAEWMEDARRHWTVENGELVNDGEGMYLATDGEYEDYELRIDYKTVPRADSGIYLKLTPQVQIWDYTDPAKFKIGSHLGSGGLWNNPPGSPGRDPLVLADRPFGEWNTFRIVQVGSRTSVWLNDQLVVNNVIMDNYYDRGAPLQRRGPVVLQTHGGEIRWRNIFVRELSSEVANAVLSEHNRQAFTTLFNGTDLTGWQGDVDNYDIVDGAIRCKKGYGGLLLTKDEYANFVARLEFRLPPGGNNGLAIRSTGEGDPAYSAMCELQVLDSDNKKYEGRIDPRQTHGSAYGMVAARRGYQRTPGEWNFQEVTVDGSTIKVELNGNVILDADLATVTEYLGGKPHPGKDRSSGYFGFSGHNDPVEFRNVAIKVLPENRSN